MNADILILLGGIGLFIFGMQTMTGALRQLASRQARAVLARFTRSPLSGVATGALTTAAVQSSSATIMTVIGFVGAGLLTFPQALGVIFGANIGSTVTGWMVAILGIKLQLGSLALGLIFLASFLMLAGSGRLHRIGLAMAGFSLLFLGLDMMQEAAQGLQGWLTPEVLPADTWGGRALLVLVGAVITIVVQASSAGVAATLVLLSGGSISLLQAGALVIGMDIGTTFKAILGALGGSRAMRQTAVAHVSYNIVTGIVAFALLGLVMPPILDHLAGGDPATALVSFHTLFNAAGVLLILPFIQPFARAIQRIIPDGDAGLAETLDRRLLADPGAALDAARVTSGAIAGALFRTGAERLRGAGRDGPPADRMQRLHLALEDLGDFLTRIEVPPDQPAPIARRSALLHQFDHLHRMAHRTERERRLETLMADRTLRRPAAALARAMERAAEDPASPAEAARLARLDALIEGRTHRIRRSELLREHAGLVSPADVFDLTDALRWLERTADHAARITHYASVAALERPDQADVGAA